MRNTTKLRNLMSENKVLVTCGVHDALGARILQDTGFKIAYMSGNATSASCIGKPDIGLMTMSEAVNHARNIINAIDIPLICDSDAGYGGEDSIARAVREWESAGVAAIHLEDQITMKRCGAMPGLELVSEEEAVLRIKTAVAARKDPDFSIIARTDAIPVYGLREAIERAWKFYEAGADIIFIEDYQNREQMEIVGRELRSVPLMVNCFEAWPWTLIDYEELGQMGFNIVFYCLSSTFAYSKALKNVFDTIIQKGTTQSITDSLIERHEYERILGLQDYAIMRRLTDDK